LHQIRGGRATSARTEFVDFAAGGGDFIILLKALAGRTAAQ